MGRHAGSRTERPRIGAARRIRSALPVAGICLLLIGAILLGVWWWHLRSITDPIDANPVDAYAVVVSSPPCSQGSRTTVQISGTGQTVTATLSGCGFTKDQRLAVQYLAGHPQQMRLAGTTIAGNAGLASKLLPIGILAAGLVAVLAAVALLVDRRRSRHLAAANRISVADLRTRAGPATGAAAAAASARVTESAVTGIEGTPAIADAADAADMAGDGAAVSGGRVGESSGDGRFDGRLAVGTDAESSGGAGPAAGAEPESGPGPAVPDLAGIDPGEPAHVLPSGFVIVDEQLFTHSGTEAPGDDSPAA